jgi:hypothetical protein
MSKMLKYMVVHDDPHISWEKVEENWSKLATVEKCIWVRTCFNKEKGLRYCEWYLWGKRWEEHLAAEETASTRGF